MYRTAMPRTRCKSTFISVPLEQGWPTTLAARIDETINSLGKDHDIVDVSTTGVWTQYASDTPFQATVLLRNSATPCVIVTVVWREES